ncbi:MAG TPA: histidine kinase [Bacteroidales bacterium]|nr:histidine kinase [Bacteroidales bacterium]
MNHPVFQNIRSAIVYFGIWVLITGIHFSVLYFQYGIPFVASLADSLTFNLIFCILGIPVYYVVRYNMPSRKSQSGMLLNQVTAMALILVIWMSSGYSILTAIFSTNVRYVVFLSGSIPYRIISGLFFYILVVFGYYLLLYNRNLQEKILAETRLNELLKEAELTNLRSQINPHFLFNSLNSISALTISNPENAREMIIRLSDFLRYSVSSSSTAFTELGNELSNIRRYLDIEKTRFGEKLVYEMKVDPAHMNYPVPVMILQPLFENAIKHGVYESVNQVKIVMDSLPCDDCLEVRIVNDFDPEAPPRKGAGIGLKNIRERLRLLYGADDLLKTIIHRNQYEVQIYFPRKK